MVSSKILIYPRLYLFTTMYLSKCTVYLTIGVLLFGFTIQNVSGQGLDDTLKNIELETSSNSAAYSTLQDAISKIGHRMSGTANGVAAENYADSLFRSYKIPKVEFLPFEMNTWYRKEVSLKIEDASGALGGISFSPPCVSLAHSPLKANIKSRIIDLGNGLKEDFENNKDKVKGQVVLMNIGIWPSNQFLKNLHRSEKTALAIQYGAKGVIMINTVAGDILLTGTASIDGELITIPAVCISFEEGQKIRGWINRDRREMLAKISLKSSFEKINARNIIASIPGTTLPDEWIIIGAHLDSWDLATGAIDNGIGSFAVIDMARTFMALGLKPARTLKFVCFMGEEQGLFGSNKLVESLKASGDLEKVKIMINLDMAGNPKGFNAFGREELLTWLDTNGASIKNINSDFGNENTNLPSLHSDHHYFMLEGIPVLSLNSNLDPSIFKFYHSNKDEFSLVNKQHLENTVKITSMLLHALSETETFPVSRQGSEATRDMLIKHNLKEQLVIGKEWRWEN